MFPAAHSFFGVVTHTYLASTSSGLNVVATSRPNIGLKVATLRPMFRFGKVTHTYLASKSPGLNVAWPQRRLASMSPGLNVAWPQCRGLNVAGLNVAWPQCPIVYLFAPVFVFSFLICIHCCVLLFPVFSSCRHPVGDSYGRRGCIGYNLAAVHPTTELPCQL